MTDFQDGGLVVVQESQACKLADAPLVLGALGLFYASLGVGA